ncbi:MAG: hypothetical protein ACP5HU_13530, partial [Phycisphaerae bacterium]
TGGTVSSVHVGRLDLAGIEHLEISETYVGDFLSTFGLTFAEGTVGQLSFGRLCAYETSSLSISGGKVGHIYAYDQSTVEISGVAEVISGHSAHNGVVALGNSSVGMSGGSITASEGLCAYENAVVSISGGSITGSNGLKAYDDSNVDVSGGSISALRAYDMCSDGGPTVNIRGGNIGIVYVHGLGLEGNEHVDISDNPAGDFLAPFGLTFAEGTIDDLIFFEIYAHEASSFAVAGGTIGRLYAYNDSRARNLDAVGPIAQHLDLRIAPHQIIMPRGNREHGLPERLGGVLFVVPERTDRPQCDRDIRFTPAGMAEVNPKPIEPTFGQETPLAEISVG